VITTYGNRGPSPGFVVVLAAAVVLICALIWLGSLTVLQDQSEQTRQRESAQQNATASAPPTFALPASPTPQPSCQYFLVDVNSAFYRDCPHTSCDIQGRLFMGQAVCTLGNAGDKDYVDSDQWYVIDLEPERTFNALYYMHQGVLKPRDPTPRPTRTFTPLPTVTLTPTFTSAPPQQSPTPAFTATPSPLPTITPTLSRTEF